MSARNDGGPAFPERAIETSGMTLRDYFAAKAMQGYISREPINPAEVSSFADAMYFIADAMIVERAKHGVSKP